MSSRSRQSDRELRILLVEDNSSDASLVERELKKGELCFSLRCVDTKESFLKELRDFSPDLVLSDYTLPSFDGNSALALAREKYPALPFIFVSGSIGEEAAIEAIKKGATDYVLKNRLSKLVPSVRRALQEAEARRERKSLEGQLFQAQKMEAIGRLAAGVAHDFNNFLTAITGYSELILQKLEDDHPLRRHVAGIQGAAERAVTLTRQLLSFSRSQETKPRVFDLNPLISERKEMLRTLVGRTVELVFLPSSGPARINADPVQIEQVIMNLAINARDAMTKGGTIVIRTADVRGRVLLSVADDGAGMDSETLSKIFEPFFTTKEKGTGLGLATVYGIVTQLNGDIQVESAVGKGSTFNIHIPAAADVEKIAHQR